MATWTPISGAVPQYTDGNGDPYSGAVLKFYAEGTSTVINLATDNTGGTTATSVALNAAGYPEVSSNVVIPHLSQDYKLVLYPTQAAADADSGAIWTVDSLTAGDAAAASAVFNATDAAYGVATSNTAAQNDTAFAAVIAAAEDSGATKKIIYTPGNGTPYDISSALVISADNIKLLGDGPARTILRKNGSMHMLTAGLITLPVTTESNTLASNTAKANPQTITLTAGKGANFTANTWCILKDDAVIEGGAVVDATQAEFIHIFSISTDTLTLSRPLRMDYTTANNAEIYRVDWVEGFELEGIGFDGNNFAQTPSSAETMLEVYFCFKPIIKDIRMWEGETAGLVIGGTYGAYLENVSGYDLRSNGFQGNSDSFGYGIQEASISEGMTIVAPQFDRVRHAYTSTKFAIQYGVPTGTRIVNGVATNSRGTAWDTHPEGHEIEFHNCVVQGSIHIGFALRGVRCRIVGGAATDTIGAGIAFSKDSIDCSASDFTLRHTNLGTDDLALDWTENGAIDDDGIRNKVDHGFIYRCGGPGIMLQDGAENGRYTNVDIIDPCQLASTNQEGMSFRTAGPTTFYAEKIDINKINAVGTMVTGFRGGAGTLTDAVLIGCRGRGYGTEEFTLAGDAVSIINGRGIYTQSVGRGSAITIASGAINLEVETLLTNVLLVSGEGASADDLDTITGGQVGPILILIYDGEAITIKHGTGNINLNGSADRVLNATGESVVLFFYVNAWYELPYLA